MTMKREEILEIGYCVPDAIIPHIWKQEEQVAERETKLNQTRKNGKETPQNTVHPQRVIVGTRGFVVRLPLSPKKTFVGFSPPSSYTVHLPITGVSVDMPYTIASAPLR